MSDAPRPLRESASGQSPGFTTIELLVTLGILAFVLVAVLELFDLNTHLARVQTDVADMQQSLRIAQYDMVRTTRMAGRGGIPLGNLPDGLAVSVNNDVPVDTFIDAPEEEHRVLPGTDVLTLRGAFSNPVFNVLPNTFTVDLFAGSGSFQLASTARPGVPVPQDLAVFRAAVDQAVPEALLLVSPLDDAIYHVVELDPGTSAVDDDFATIGFRINGGTNTDEYWVLSGSNWDPALTDASSVAILEEYRFYVREGRVIPDDPSSDPKPSLARAQVFPGTQNPYRGQNANWSVLLADNIFDLQVALGIDTAPGAPATPPDGQLVDLGTADDEWLFNHPDDDPLDPGWVGDAVNRARLYYVRINTVGITQRPDRKHRAAIRDRLEDRVYTVDDDDLLHGPQRRQYRRRTLSTVVDLRNIS
jgi:type II secretory pathway pseudopilin PulG